MILTRVRPSLYIPLWVCAWSVISGATAGTQSYGGLVAVRFCLGIAEAPVRTYGLIDCLHEEQQRTLTHM